MFHELGAGAGTGDNIIRLFRNRARHLGAETLGGGLGLVACHLLQRTGKHNGLAGDSEIRARLFRIDNLYLLRQPLDAAAIVWLGKIFTQALDHGVADLIERVHVLFGLVVALSKPQARLVKVLPGPVAARQRHCGRFADVADAERVNEPLKRDLAPRVDGVEQIAHRGCAKAFDLFEADFFSRLLQRKFPVARFKRENICRLIDPALLVEKFDLLFAQSVDVEGAAGDEVLEVPYYLKGTCKLASTVGASTFRTVAVSSRVTSVCRGQGQYFGK